VDVVCATRLQHDASASSYDAVLVTASVHEGRFLGAESRWVRAHTAELSGRPSAFLPVCLAVLEHRPEARVEINAIVQGFFIACRWRPSALRLVAGAVPYSRYGWLKKWIMRRISAKAGGGTDTSRDYEYTDWNDVRTFVRDFAAAHELRATSAGAPALAAR
jgi:menaquinone-dependent protoporphyrinogen oxidase